ISRQRYWGTPIPIVHCAEHGAQPVPYDQLPVKLPEDCIPDGSGNPLNKHEGFHAGAACPICGKAARRETDTMDTFVDSSWYFIRYCLPEADQKASAAMTNSAVDYWMPRTSAMDQYIGGIEHAVLHLLYARFWTKVMRDVGLMKADEPFTKLLCQGMVLNHIFFWRDDKGGKNYFPPENVTPVLDAQGRLSGGKLTQSEGAYPKDLLLEYGGVGKMGKTERNGVDPQDLIDKYGADTARLYTMFTAPPEATLEWNDGAVEGSYRFLRRVWQFCAKHADALGKATSSDFSQAALRKETKALRRELHLVLKQVSYDYERMQYNTVVSGTMKMLNALEGHAFDGSDGDTAVLCEGASLLLRSLYPATPHLSHQVWSDLGFAKAVGDLLDAPWPQVDESALQQDEIELMLQIGGKLRGSILVPAGASKEQIEAAALAHESVVRAAAGAAPKKIIVVPGRLVNIVL
ncbi:MAG: class I tRNA ligase family protein, partial [Brachymonas sp.]